MPGDMPNVVWMNLDTLNLDEGASVQMFDLAEDFEASGEIHPSRNESGPYETRIE